MDNASKALILATEVIIGILIMTMAVYLFLSFNTSATSMEKEMEESQITNFNNQFLAYEGKNDLTIYDVFTVANLAEENNKKYEIQDEGKKDYNYYVQVNLRILSESSKSRNNIEKNKLKHDSLYKDYRKNGELMKFTCQVSINSNTKLVNTVTFTEKI